MGVDPERDAEFTRAVSEYLIPSYVVRNDAIVSRKVAATTGEDDQIEVTAMDLRT